MTIREQLDVYVKERYGIGPELLPFSKEDYGVYRHPDTGKWFAVFIDIPVMMFAMGYPSDKTKPSPWHFQRKPIEDTVTKL